MFNLHRELSDFHNQHVRLGSDEKKKLAGYRDANLDRLKSGLDKLGEEDGREYARPARDCNQGSYAMHTLIQRPENSYDIDVGIVFRKADLPDSALDARKRVAAAVQKGGGNFRRPPEPRTNAVTVWYAEGYHVDLAVYRESIDAYGRTVTEHAGADWTRREPMEMTDWFNGMVREHSPSGELGAAVEAGQMRRVVRLVKAFAKSRDSWNLPGGLIISVLVAQCYQPDRHRDDLSLYQTMAAIHNRLLRDISVLNPVDSSQLLTDKTEHVYETRELRDRLGEAIPRLGVLFESNCTYQRAMDAWHSVFQHPFWTSVVREAPLKAQAERFGEASVLGSLSIVAGVAKESGGAVVRYHISDHSIQKGWWLRFSVAQTSVDPPYEVRWIVKNYGVEAEQADDLGPRVDGDGRSIVQWEHTKYQGRHTMTCQLCLNGVILAQAQHFVRVT